MQQVLKQEQRCKNVRSTLTKLSRRSHCPQLTKALSPQSTFITEHAERLKLIKKLIGFTKSPAIKSQITTLSFPIHISIGKKSATQDSLIIRFALKLFSSTNKALDKLSTLAIDEEEELIISLIKQSISENCDTIIWLKRILNNVVQPDLKMDIK